MPALYLDSQGARLKKQDGTYVVCHQQNQHQFPASQVERILLLGNVQLSTQVVNDALRRGIPVYFLSSRGQYRGKLTAATHANVGLRMRQYTCAQDRVACLSYARWFVIAKIRNCKELIARKLKAMRLPRHAHIRNQLKRYMYQAGRAQSIDQLLGIEGTAARLYFQCFTSVFAHTDFTWQGRNRRPPKDPINAMLSLGYTLLLNECVTALESIGLDIYAGFLHGGLKHSDYGKPALALDLMEEFRYLVDRLTMRLLVCEGFSPEDFEIDPNQGCAMRPKARKAFFTAWEALMQSQILYDHRRLSYRQIIGAQAQLLARALQDKHLPYSPFTP